MEVYGTKPVILELTPQEVQAFLIATAVTMRFLSRPDLPENEGQIEAQKKTCRMLASVLERLGVEKEKVSGLYDEFFEGR